MRHDIAKSQVFEHEGSCRDCGATWDKNNAAALAALHAKSKGHRTRVLTRVTKDYDGKRAGGSAPSPWAEPEDWSELL